MANSEDALIPYGEYCYSVEVLGPGESLSNDVDRYGFDLREFRYHNDRKAILCPYWRRTSHGTVRCEKLLREVFAERESFEVERMKAAAHFGEKSVGRSVGYSYELADEIKVCNINMTNENDL